MTGLEWFILDILVATNAKKIESFLEAPVGLKRRTPLTPDEILAGLEAGSARGTEWISAHR
jgi:hypothetical protein